MFIIALILGLIVGSLIGAVLGLRYAKKKIVNVNEIVELSQRIPRLHALHTSQNAVAATK